MANDKKFVVKRGLVAPNVDFANGGGTITATYLNSSNTLSFSGNTGQLFSITDSMSGTIFSVNDISGIPSIEVIDTGAVKLAETFGSVNIGANGQSSYKFYVNGNSFFNNTVTLNSTLIANGSSGTAGLVLTSNGTGVYWASANAGIASVLTANNSTYAYGKQESQLNANNSTYSYGKQESQLNANNSTYSYGKQEAQLSVANAVFATSANNALRLNGKQESQLAANSAVYLNGKQETQLNANNSTYSYGKQEAQLSVANAVFAQTSNNALRFNGKQEAQLSVANAVYAQTAGSVLGGNVSGSVSTANNSSYLDGRTWQTPFAIGATVANTGAFTTLTASANVNIDSGTLFTDANNNRVGVGTTTPIYKLEVNGSFAATTKSFVIDHPTKDGMKLRYGSLEGPENGVYVRGRLKGNNTIVLPDYWTGLVDENTITVNLSPIGKHQKLYVEDISNNQIIIGNDNLINKEIDCFFTVFAERKDVDKLEVEI